MKLVCCVLGLVCLSIPLAAQGVTATSASSAALPDAPSALLVSESSSFLQTASPTPAPAAAPDLDRAQQTPEERKAEAERELKQEESQRMLGLMPAFNAVLNGQAVPLSPGQKFRLFFRGIIDPFQFTIVGVDTALQEAEDSYPEYHHGIPGVLRNYGAAYADDFDGNLFGNAILPVLLHQDPRYFRLGHGSKKHRLLYAVGTTVRAKGDNGKWQPNYSNIGGNFIGGAISNLYYPASDRGVGLTLERGVTVTAYGVVGALAIEFYPDFQHMMERRKERKAEQRATSAKGPGPHVYPNQP